MTSHRLKSALLPRSAYARSLEQLRGFVIRAIVGAEGEIGRNEAKALAEAAEKLKPPV
jgi:hypothetical protein